MKFEPKEISLKDGRKALLRSPTVDDAQDLLNYLKQTAGEPLSCCAHLRNAICP